MAEPFDFNDIIRQILAGTWNGAQPTGDWQYAPMYKPTGGSGFGDGGDGQAALDPNTTVGAQRVRKEGRNNWLEEYGLDGKLTDARQWTDPTLLQEAVTAAAVLAAPYFGGAGLSNMASGGTFLGGVQSALPWAEAAAGADAAGTIAGSGAVDAVGGEVLKTLASSLPGTLPAMGAPIATTVAPLTMAEFMTAMVPSALNLSAGASGLQTAMKNLNPSFLDKVGTFFSDPKNILSTVGALGSLKEAFDDDPADPNANWTQNSTKNLDPRLASVIYGADGNSGVLKDLTDWAAKYPTGQNQTMIDAQAGLRGLLTDPRVMNGYMTMGGTGLGLLGRGIAPNPWLPNNGG